MLTFKPTQPRILNLIEFGTTGVACFSGYFNVAYSVIEYKDHPLYMEQQKLCRFAWLFGVPAKINKPVGA